MPYRSRTLSLGFALLFASSIVHAQRIPIEDVSLDDPFPTATYLLLKQDILIEADIWRDEPEILAANYAFEGIIGVPQNEGAVRAAGGTWMKLPEAIAENAPARAFTTSSSSLGTAATYGYPVSHADAMPIVFSWPVLPSTVDPTDFEIHLNDGSVVTPNVASIFPNIEYNERNTVVVFGEFGNRLPPDDPDARYIVKTVIVADDTPLTLIGPDRTVSAVGLERVSAHPYVEGGGPTLAGAKLNYLSTAGEGGPAVFSGQLPNDGKTLYGSDAQFRLRILTTGGFSPDGVSSVLPTDFETFFRLHARDGEETILIERAGEAYTLSGGTLEVVGLAELGLPEFDPDGNLIAPYDLAYIEDHDNYIDIILKGDEAAMRQITHVEIPAEGDYLPFYNPGGPGNDPTPGVRYTMPGSPTLQEVVIALDDPRWVTSWYAIDLFYPEAEPTGVGRWHSSWYGDFRTYERLLPWIIHDQHGWQWIVPVTPGKAYWQYDPEHGWTYLDQDSYPWIYYAEPAQWFYFSGHGTHTERWLWNETQGWIIAADIRE